LETIGILAVIHFGRYSFWPLLLYCSANGFWTTLPRGYFELPIRYWFC